MPGSQRSSEPWITSNRFPRRVSRLSRSGIQGASPRTASTVGSAAAWIATAPPIEKPSRSVRGAPVSSTAAIASATHQSICFHDLIRYFTSAKPSSGNSRASLRTSHSIDALQVPATSPLCPPFTQTIAACAAGPVTRISAPVARRVTPAESRSTAVLVSAAGRARTSGRREHRLPCGSWSDRAEARQHGRCL